MAAASSTLVHGVCVRNSFESGFITHLEPRCFVPRATQKKHGKLQLCTSRKSAVCVNAEYKGQGNNAGDFLAGFLVGGAVFGALGYLFAPQISKALSGDEDRPRKRLPKLRMDDDEGLEKTRKTLNEKIAQLNAAIDDVSAQLRAEDGASEPTLATANAEPEPMGD